jgi:hypothetical protein
MTTFSKREEFSSTISEVRSAPLWNSRTYKFSGMLTVTDFVKILTTYYYSYPKGMSELEDHRISTWRGIYRYENSNLKRKK